MDDKVEAYVRLYERQMTHYEKTQDVEWKISFGVWALLAGAIFWVAQNAAALKPIPVDGRLVVLIPALPLIHALWLSRVHKSEEFDKRLWCRYRLAARTILLAPSAVPDDEKESNRDVSGEVGWIVLEVGVTFIMAIVLYLFLS